MGAHRLLVLLAASPGGPCCPLHLPSLSWQAWRSVLEEHVPGEVFSFPLFSPAFCELFLEELDHFYASGLPARRPNSMNNYGVVINDMGLELMIDRLQVLACALASGPPGPRGLGHKDGPQTGALHRAHPRLQGGLSAISLSVVCTGGGGGGAFCGVWIQGQ